jgi:hypothetical protein
MDTLPVGPVTSIPFDEDFSCEVNSLYFVDELKMFE